MCDVEYCDTYDIASDVAVAIMTSFDEHFRYAIELLDAQQEVHTKYDRNKIDVVKNRDIFVSTLNIGANLFYKLTKRARRNRGIMAQRRMVNDRFLLYMDMHFSKKYGITTHSVFEPENHRLKITLTKGQQLVGDAEMVVVITLKDKVKNVTNTIVTDMDSANIEDVIEIKKLAEMRRSEWPEVEPEEVLQLVERKLLDRGVKLLAYDNYLIEY
jgi:hypothetical protein